MSKMRRLVVNITNFLRLANAQGKSVVDLMGPLK